MIITIVLVLALSPMLFSDVFAFHVDRFTGGQYDDAFYWQEIDNTAGLCHTIGHGSGGGFRLESSGSSPATRWCSFFKVFDVEDVHNKVIELNFGSSTGSASQTSVKRYIQVHDGAYTAGDATDFPEDSAFLAKGAGQLYSSGGFSAPDNPFTPDLSSATLPQVTIFFTYFDDVSTSLRAQFAIHHLQIQDLGEWNFCYNASVLCDPLRPPIVGETGTTEDWGTVYSIEAEYWVAGADVTDLDVTVTNNTSVIFDWTEVDDAGIGIQDVNTGMNVTGYILEYKNGTASESDYWTYIADPGDVEVYETGNIFEAGHGYTARLISVGYDEFLSDPSNEITFTMTGSSVTDETFDERYEHLSDGVDNRFYWTERTGSLYFNGQVNVIASCNADWYPNETQGMLVLTNESGASKCLTFIKSFPSADVMDVPWTLEHSYFRSLDQTYHEFQIYDGRYENMYDTSIFRPESSWNQVDMKYRFLNGTVSVPHDAELYSFGATVPSPSSLESFTPTGATEEWVTVVIELSDLTANDAGVAWTSLEIEGYNKWFFPMLDTDRALFPFTDYIEGELYDWGYVRALFAPQTPVLSIEADGDNAILTWTAGAGGQYVGDTTGYKIEKQCPVGGGWKVFIADTGDTTLTYTDVNYADAVGVSFSEDFTVNDWTHTDEQNPDFITVSADPTDGFLHFGVETNTADTRSYKELGFALDDEQWIMEYKLNFDNLDSGSGANYFYFGVVANEFLSVETLSNDAMVINMLYSGAHNLYMFTKDGASESRVDTTFNLGEDDEDLDQWYWVQMARTSSTSMTLKWSQYGTSFNEDNLVVDFVKTNLPATITDLDILYASGAIIASASERDLGGRISDVIIGNGVSYIQANSDSCVYRVSALNSLGASQPSNEGSISSEGATLTAPTNFTCQATGTGSVDLTWDYTGEETAEGFRIDSEIPLGAGFNVHLADTGSASTVRTLTGLNSDTTYNFKVAVLVDPDTSGFSNEDVCKTDAIGGGSGGGSGGESPSDPIIIEDPETGEDTVSGDDFETITPSTPISEGQSDIFDLTFPFIQELTNEFSGDIFTLVGAKHSAGLGQTIEGSMLVGWNNQQNILLNTVLVAPTQLSVNLNPLPPYIAEGGLLLNDNQIQKLSIIPPTSPNIQSHQLIPYSITIPSVFCGAGITADCVEPGTHKIPVKVVSTQGGQNIANTARIEVAVGIPTIQFDIPTFVMIALIIVAIIGAYQVSRKIKGKKKQSVKHV